MSDAEKDITPILEAWPIQPDALTARKIVGLDGQEQIQLRIPMGILQMNPEGRPDGESPGGFETALQWLQNLLERGERIEPEHWVELDREIMQFYHRRIALLAIAEHLRREGKLPEAATDYARIVRDADHNLQIMDFIRAHHTDDDYIEAHEQYRPFVLGHRTLAAGLYWLCVGEPAEAIDTINAGLDVIRRVYQERDRASAYDRDPTVTRLRRLVEEIRQEHGVVQTLREQLAEAVATENFERAAELRDQIKAKAASLKAPFKSL